MITLHIHYNNHTEYYSLESFWAANLIAMNIMRRVYRVESVYIVDNQTGEICKTFTRG